MFEPTGFSLQIFQERYAFTPQETFQEAARRVADQMARAETPDKQKTYADMFFSVLSENLFVPGGRIWYNSGRTNPQLLNCVSGDTLVHIKGGKVRADSLVGQEVETLSIGGQYRKAKWDCYGKQSLLKVILENGDELVATPNHEWIVSKNGKDKIVTTIDLKDKKIPFEHVRNFAYNEEDYKLGIKHGMIYGDGSVIKFNGKPVYSEIKQFGPVNTACLLKYFADEQILSYQDKRYGTVYYASKLPVHFKQLPTTDKSQSYIRGFLAGFLATDGHIDNRGSGGFYQSNLEHLKQIKELASYAGIPTKSIKLFRRLNPFNGKEAPNYKLTFYKNIWKDDPKLVIKQSHIDNLAASADFLDRRCLVKVVDVVPTGRVEEVFCCVEPETHTMVIGNGYLTKQCFVLNPEKDSREGWGRSAQDMIVTSMTGGGCGDDFSDVRPRGATITGQKGTAPGAVELMRLIDACAKPVKNGGQRRVALMFSLDLDHPDIEEFLNAKLAQGELTHANVSVRSKRTKEFIKAIKNDTDWELSWKGKYKRTVRARELWNTIVQNAYNSAEPGFLNWELVESESNIWYIEPLVTTNPCITGDTLIATADGRNAVSIEQLAFENKDVPVYSTNLTTGQVEIKMGRNPRKTGSKSEVWKLTLDDGTALKATPNHKILTKDLSYVELKDLRVGQSIYPFNSFDCNGYRQVSNTGAKMSGGARRNRRQYRLIAEFNGVNVDAKTHAIHHKDFDSGNDSYDNLVVMTHESHRQLHSERMRGDKNPYHQMSPEWKAKLASKPGSLNGRWIDVSNEELIEAGRALLARDGKLNTDNWQAYAQENGLPQTLSNKARFGNFNNFKSLVVGNHKVVSVEFLGYEDVYNITVDDNHNYHVITSMEDGRAITSSGICVKNCGEIALSAYDCCCLGHLVLPRFIKDGEMDFHMLGNTIRTAVRFLDNVLTVNNYPIPEMKAKSGNLRRIGLGTTGLADALATLGFRYGSTEGNKFIDKLYRFISKAAYESSVLLAVEKGMFPLCNPEKHVESGFMKRMPEKIKALVREHGIRNCAILTQAPTGCQRPDTLVTTDQGLLMLGELVDESGQTWQDISSINVFQESGITGMSKGFVNGVRETKRIRLNSGLELESTGNHQYRVFNSNGYIWKAAEDLSLGDKIVCKIGGYDKVTEVALKTNVETAHNVIHYTLPSQTSPELGWFLGLFFADGSVHEKGIRIGLNANEKSLNDGVAERIKNLFGLEVKRYIEDGVDNFYLNSKELLAYLKTNDLLKGECHQVEIPKAIRCASKATLAAFIDGYGWGDGHALTSNPKMTVYDTVSKNMAQQLIVALRALGRNTVTRIKTSGKTEGRYGTLPLYSVKEVSFGTFGQQQKERYLLKSRQADMVNARTLFEGAFLDEIVSIEDGFNMTLDIEVPKNHTYLANSVVSHNTVSILSGNCSSGIEPMFAPAYERRYWVGEERKKELVYHPLFAQFMRQGKNVDHFVGSQSLTVRDHLEVQAIVQKHVDNAVSKTVNIAEDCPVDEMEAAWMEYLPRLKGTTFYRENTRGFVNPKTGLLEEPPLKALTLDEATLKFWSETHIEDTETNDCASGACDIKFTK